MSGKESYSTGGWCASEALWIFWRRQKTLAPTGSLVMTYEISVPVEQVLLIFYILLTVCYVMILGKWPTWRTFFSMYLFIFLTLYMFRAHRAHHQERQIVSILPLVAVTLCRWPCRLQVGSELQFTSDLYTTRPPTQIDSYQRMYWHNLSLLMMNTLYSKHIES